MNTATGKRAAESPQSERRVVAVEVASALLESGYDWSPTEIGTDRWKAVVTDPRGRYELVATIIAGGVEVSSTLAQWETGLPEASRAALTSFLAEVHDRILATRFDQHAREVRAVCFVATERVGEELSDKIAALIAACQFVGREVRALADEAVAKSYLEINR